MRPLHITIRAAGAGARPRHSFPTSERLPVSVYRLVAFDLDDTLAPSKTAIDPRMTSLLSELLRRAEVCVISGGTIDQFLKQVVTRLSSTSDALLARLHLMPTCGTQYYRYGDGQWEEVYAEYLTGDEKQRATDAITGEVARLDLAATTTWGPTIEDRGSQITFSALGQFAPIDKKAAWDPTGAKKEALRTAVAPLLPDLEVRSGGSTSIDVTRHGIDKAYGMSKLSEITGISYDEMLFIGDRLDEGGNDYPVKRLGIHTHAVEGWLDTAEFLDEFLGQEKEPQNMSTHPHISGRRTGNLGGVRV